MEGLVNERLFTFKNDRSFRTVHFTDNTLLITKVSLKRKIFLVDNTPKLR